MYRFQFFTAHCFDILPCPTTHRPRSTHSIVPFSVLYSRCYCQYSLSKTLFEQLLMALDITAAVIVVTRHLALLMTLNFLRYDPPMRLIVPVLTAALGAYDISAT